MQIKLSKKILFQDTEEKIEQPDEDIIADDESDEENDEDQKE